MNLPVAETHPLYEIVKALSENLQTEVSIEIEEAGKEWGPAYDDIIARFPDVGRVQVRIEYRMTEDEDERRYWMAVANGDEDEDGDDCRIVELPTLELACEVAEVMHWTAEQV